MKELFDEADSDESGGLTFDEFVLELAAAKKRAEEAELANTDPIKYLFN